MIEIGDKIFCTCTEFKDEEAYHITVGKCYVVIDQNRGERIYEIICDNGDEMWYDHFFFRGVEEHRRNQLDKLLL
jgi:hypothetical protein